jgi:hypothetical protein
MKAIGVAAAMILAVACGPSTIAGFAVGERRCDGGLAIDPGGTETCDQYTTFARMRLDAASPPHAPIVAIELYQDPVTVALGGYGVRAIVVMHLADERVVVYRVQCGLGLSREMCLALPHDPMP